MQNYEIRIYDDTSTVTFIDAACYLPVKYYTKELQVSFYYNSIGIVIYFYHNFTGVLCYLPVYFTKEFLVDKTPPHRYYTKNYLTIP